MTLLIAVAAWMLVLLAIAGLCMAARRGDTADVRVPETEYGLGRARSAA